MVADRDADGNQETARLIRDGWRPGARRPLRRHRGRGDRQPALQAAVDGSAGSDFAFNNAGIEAPPTDAADEVGEQFDRLFAVNLRGAFPA